MPDTDILDAGPFTDLVSQGRSALLDVRSPGEYGHAHMPGAVNLPLLDDAARKEVGITYKTKGHDAAVEKGFDLTGSRFAGYIREAKKIADGRPVAMYCWRGGLRSGIMSWLLQTAGCRVTLLKGGYKAFRRWVPRQFDDPRRLVVLGGKTGCGKTELLHALEKAGEQVIDLEALAHHKGSAFGDLGQPPQPGNEQFENDLAMQWRHTDPQRTVWIENESRLIGSCLLPEKVFDEIRAARVIEISLDRTIRMKRILDEYGRFPVDKLREKTGKVKKRLGGLLHKQAIEALDAGRMEEWCDIMISYYDRTYDHSNNQREPGSIETFSLAHDRMEAHVGALIAAACSLA